jgi:CPA1 family monovalent cation:H+ antiporter
MDIFLERTVLLLIVAILVALVARRLHLPYTVGLVITGIALALTHLNIELTLTHEFIYDVILPPLLFEAALHIEWKELRRDLPSILTLATLGVIISALFVAWGMMRCTGWPWHSCVVFGVLIAATDPVAVIAMFKDTGVRGRLRLRVESESLFNDGVAAVFLALVLSQADAVGGAAITPLHLLQTLAFTVGGGVFIGAVASGIATAIAGSTSDHLIETALTTVVAYGSFLFAEHLQVSGVLATVVAGLFMGNGLMNTEGSALSQRGHSFVLDFWEFVAFLANSLIFLLIGLRVAVIPFGALGLAPLLAATLLVTFGRALAVYPLCLLFFRSRWAIPLREQHVLWWGGLRGALALALALSLPRTLPHYEEIVVATFGVVAFSILIQGLTMPLLLKKLKLLPA